MMLCERWWLVVAVLLPGSFVLHAAAQAAHVRPTSGRWGPARAPPQQAERAAANAGDSALPGQRMVRLSGEAQAGGAACLDGSDYAFYIVPGSTKAFSIAVHGGGWCADEVECAERSKTALGSSTSWNLTSCFGPPGFNCYGLTGCTMVFMPYCDGSSFTGHREGTWPVPNSTDRLTFRGNQNFERTIDVLIRDWGLGEATDVVLSGGSAGGLTTMLKLDRLAERLPAAVIVGMPVAGYFADLGRAPFAVPEVKHYPGFPHYRTPFPDSFRGYMQYLYTMHNSSAGLQSASGLACQEHYRRDGQEWKCSMAPYAQAFIATPFFSVQSRFDEFQLGPGIAHVPCEIGQTYAPPYRTDTIHVCNETEREFIVDYGAHFLQQYTPVLQSAKHGCFLVSCIQHGIDARIDNLSSVDAFTRWRTKSTTGAQHGYHFVDNCGDKGTTPCNPGAGCAPPHINLKTEDDEQAASGLTTAAICTSEDRKGLVSVRGACPANFPHSIQLAGVNIFDVWSSFAPGAHTCCDAPHGPHAPCCTKGNVSDAVRALEDLKASGIRAFRFFAQLYGAQMAQWIHEENTYWAAFDQLIDTVERLRLFAIPSLGYCLHAAGNEAFGLNETINDCMRNESAVGFALEQKYYRQLVHRYANRHGILFWELGNELNNQANLPPGHCGPDKCFNTSEMVALTGRLVSTIKAIDPIRPISSGFSMPRPAAWHMEHRPVNGPEVCQTNPNDDACYWAVDTEAQWTAMLKLQNSAVDIWSVHHYESANRSTSCDGTNAHSCKSCFFDHLNCTNGVALTMVAARAAKAAGKVLYQGEYGGPSPTFTGPRTVDVAYPTAILDAQVRSSETGAESFLVSTIWAWECASQRDTMICIWLSSKNANESGSLRMIQEITDANRRMERRV